MPHWPRVWLQTKKNNITKGGGKGDSHHLWLTIWLVLSSDADCHGQETIGWKPVEYLFEDIGIFFHYAEASLLNRGGSF